MESCGAVRMELCRDGGSFAEPRVVSIILFDRLQGDNKKFSKRMCFRCILM